MAGKVFVTGGAGFVGRAVLAELLARDYSVNALVNHKPIEPAEARVQSFPGGLFDNAALDAAMAGCSAVIHLVGIIMEKKSKGITFDRIHYQGTKHIVDAARRNGIKRYVQMSALGARADAVSNYHKTKFLAEGYVRGSGLDWTIIRPSLIHGPGGEFMRMEALWARKKAPPPVFFMPIMPYFGAGLTGSGGAGKLQPVYVKDVARAFVDSIEKPATIGEVFPLGGTQEVTWPEMHQLVANAVVGHDRLVVPMPVWVAKLYAKVGIGKIAGFNWDQVVMSQEDNTTDLTKFTEAFGWTPVGFGETVKGYAGGM